MNELLRRMLFLPRQGSDLAREIDGLHYVVILITMGGATLVAAAAVYFMIKYRRGAHPADTEVDHRPGHTAGGITWTFEAIVAGFLLTMFVLFWIVGFQQFVRIETAPRDAIEIQVIGKKWMWTFAYPNGRGSKSVLYVPQGRPVKLSLTSRDVIHSFFLPEFRVKKDAIPGRTTELWFEASSLGNHPVYCTEYCGEGHSTMRARVVALSDADYARALEGLPPLEIAGPSYEEPAVAGQPPAEGLSLARMGERVATNRGCMRCHTPDGTPHIGPSWLGMYGATVPLEGGGRVTADAAYLTESMMDPRAKIRLGYPPVMPSYQGILTAPEAGAVLEYLRAVASPTAALQPAPLAPAGAPSIRLPSEGREENP